MKTNLQKFLERNRYYTNDLRDSNGSVSIALRDNIGMNYAIYLIGQRNHGEWWICDELLEAVIMKHNDERRLVFLHAAWSDD